MAKHRFRGRAPFCILAHCSNFSKCQLRLTTKVIADAKENGSEVDVMQACVYLHHHFGKTKDKK